LKGEEGVEILERGFAPLLPAPPSLIKGKGQGDRLINNLNESRVFTRGRR